MGREGSVGAPQAKINPGITSAIGGAGAAWLVGLRAVDSSLGMDRNHGCIPGSEKKALWVLQRHQSVCSHSPCPQPVRQGVLLSPLYRQEN